MGLQHSFKTDGNFVRSSIKASFRHAVTIYVCFEIEGWLIFCRGYRARHRLPIDAAIEWQHMIIRRAEIIVDMRRDETVAELFQDRVASWWS